MKIRIIISLFVISFCSATLCWGQTWNLTPSMKAVLNNGTLTITTTAASEAMPDFWWGFAPWNNVSHTIQSIVIGENVTSVGDHAFLTCRDLTSVNLPNSLKVIGVRAFDGCSSLSVITIPDAVTTIDDYAFFTCESLVTVDIPALVSHIGLMVFDDCHALTAICVDAANASYMSDDGVLYNKDKTSIILYPEKKSGTTFAIPNTVKIIESAAFNYSTLSSITIPDAVTEIKFGAFWKCEKLAAITLPNSLETLGEDAFHECTSLTSITIPASVKEIGYGAFSYCSKLASFQVNAANTAYMSEAGILYTKDKTVIHTYPAGKSGTFTIPSTVKTIGNYAFTFSPLTSITIPGSVVTLGEHAFRECTNLISIEIPNSVTIIGNNAFHKCTKLASVTLPDFITEIEFHTFSSCTNLASITIPDMVKEIGSYAFYECTSLTSIILPASVEKICWCAFHTCTNLASITMSNSIETIEGLAFANCEKLTSLTIPNSVKEIVSEAFWYCTGLKDVKVSWETPLSVPDDIFGGVNTKTVTLHVPNGTTALYQAANVWKSFEKYLEYDPAGIEDIGNQNMKAYISNGMLIIDGLEAGQQWSVFSITGTLMFQGTADSVETRHALPLQRGIYIVESEGRTVKVMMN